jgi:hypothetical protein
MVLRLTHHLAPRNAAATEDLLPTEVDGKRLAASPLRAVGLASTLLPPVPKHHRPEERDPVSLSTSTTRCPVRRQVETRRRPVTTWFEPSGDAPPLARPPPCRSTAAAQVRVGSPVQRPRRPRRPPRADRSPSVASCAATAPLGDVPARVRAAPPRRNAASWPVPCKPAGLPPRPLHTPRRCRAETLPPHGALATEPRGQRTDLRGRRAPPRWSAAGVPAAGSQVSRPRPPGAAQRPDRSRFIAPQPAAASSRRRAGPPASRCRAETRPRGTGLSVRRSSLRPPREPVAGRAETRPPASPSAAAPSGHERSSYLPSSHTEVRPGSRQRPARRSRDLDHRAGPPPAPKRARRLGRGSRSSGATWSLRPSTRPHAETCTRAWGSAPASASRSRLPCPTLRAGRSPPVGRFQTAAPPGDEPPSPAPAPRRNETLSPVSVARRSRDRMVLRPPGPVTSLAVPPLGAGGPKPVCPDGARRALQEATRLFRLAAPPRRNVVEGPARAAVPIAPASVTRPGVTAGPKPAGSARSALRSLGATRVTPVWPFPAAEAVGRAPRGLASPVVGDLGAPLATVPWTEVRELVPGPDRSPGSRRRVRRSLRRRLEPVVLAPGAPEGAPLA